MPETDLQTLDRIISILEKAASVMVVSHDRPDGDAIGSAIAMGRILRELGKTVEVVNHDSVPDSLQFLPGKDGVLPPSGVSSADVLLVLDSAGKNRIHEDVWAMACEIDTVINVDHHISNELFGDLNYVDSGAPATGQIVFELAARAGWKLDAEVAENLYAAISTDTGSFRYPSTSSRTYRIAADLVDLGIDVGQINQNLYERYPERRIQLLRKMLMNLRIDFDGRCASVALPMHISRELQIQPGDSEGVVDVIRSIDTVIVAVLFEELPNGKIRVSSRSKDERFSVQDLCAEFGGGGHKLAAGARLAGPLGDAVKRFLAAAGKRLQAI